VREHRYSVEFPHSARRLWALFQDYDRWTEYAPMVLEVQVLWPGDENHNGRLRRVIYKMPMGRQGSALELVTDVEPERGYTYTMISKDPANDQTGKVRQSHPLPLRGALQHRQATLQVVRRADLQVHQQAERGVDASRLGVAVTASRLPRRPRRCVISG